MPLVAIRQPVLKALLAGASVDIRQPKKSSAPRWEIGKDYLLSSKHSARFIVRDIRSEYLHEADDDQAQRERFRDAEELFAHWRETYGTGPLVEVETWVITTELDRSHKLRLLHRDSSHGYTSNPGLALQDAGEAVEPAYDKRFREDADLIAGQQEAIYEAAWEAQSLIRRLQKLIDDPNTSREQLFSIERRISQLEKRAQRRAA